MFWDLIRTWFSALLGGTLLGALLGGFLFMAFFAALFKFGLWRHPRLAGGWRIAALSLLGLYFAALGILAGAAWGFCRAAEERLLATRLDEAPFLKEKLAPLSAGASQFIGAALVLAEHPEWLKGLGEAKSLPPPALAAIAAFERGELHLDSAVLEKHLGSLSRAGVEKLFPMLEEQVAARQPGLLASPLYVRLRPHLLELLVGLLENQEKEAIGQQQSWLVARLAEASRADGRPGLSCTELQSGMEGQAFQKLCCQPAAAVIAAERWQISLLLTSLLLLPALLFLALRFMLPGARPPAAAQQA